MKKSKEYSMLPFGMKYQEKPDFKARGYIDAVEKINYSPKLQHIDVNSLQTMMATTWSMITSTFPFLAPKDPDHKEDDKT